MLSIDNLLLASFKIFLYVCGWLHAKAVTFLQWDEQSHLSMEQWTLFVRCLAFY